jgi:CheY-like chemotaxis protein
MAAKSMRILLVEDDPYDTLLIVKALEDHTMWHIRAVEDGAQALAYLRGEYAHLEDPFPDLILLDLKLSGWSGLDLLTEIKANPNYCHIPVVVLSNSAYDNDVNLSYSLRANCFIQKPIAPLKFRQVIRQTVDFWAHTVMLPL